MAKRHTVIVVPETHWDREWYSTFQQFRIRLVRLTDKLLQILDAGPDYRSFTFDGQTIVIEDYLAIRPENAKRIAAYVKQGRLLVGPWYVLPDEFLVSGEAIIRNLMLGHRIAAGLGRVMHAGYVPDPFGHLAQLPQILRGFGLDSALFMRGMGEQTDRLANEFWWEAPDGSRVLAVHLLTSYCNYSGWGRAGWLSEDPTPDFALAVEQARAQIAAHAPTAATRYLLANNGCDHVEPQPELPDIIAYVNAHLDDAEFVHGSYEDFVRGVLAENPQLGVWRGELHDGKHTQILSGVFSARMYLKQANERTQTLLERWAEPASALAWLWGRAYDPGLLWEAWRLCLQNHPHDSICGCSIDQVHREMLPRFEQSQQIGEQLTAEGLRHLAAQADTRVPHAAPDARALVVFNPLGWEWSGAVQAKLELPHAPGAEPTPFIVRDAQGAEVPCQITRDHLAAHRNGVPEGMDVREVNLWFRADRLPGLGYDTYSLESGVPAPAQSDLIVGERSAENEFIALTINANGTVDIRDKRNGAVYRGLNLFESTEDLGDEYDYSPAEKSMTVTTADAQAKVRLVESGPLRATFAIDIEFGLPAAFDRTATRRSADLAQCSLTVFATLQAGSPRVDFRTVVANRSRDHRLRAVFPSGLQAPHSDAEQQFCIVDRPLQPTPHPDWCQPPVPTQAQLTFVDAHDAERGLTVINQGLPEYEMRPGEEGATIYLTLLRCVGWLSRGDLVTRSGNAGPELPTPEAQCLGEHEFHYAVLPHLGNWMQAKVWQQAHSHNAPPRVVVTDQHAGSHPRSLGFLTIDTPDIVLSAVKKAEREEALIVRVYNTTSDPVTGHLRLGQPMTGWRPVNLNEEPQPRARRRRVGADGSLRLSLRPYEIATLALYAG